MSEQISKKELDDQRATAAPAWFSQLKQELAFKSKRELVRMLAETLVMLSNANKTLQELQSGKSQGTSTGPTNDNEANQQGREEDTKQRPSSPTTPS